LSHYTATNRLATEAFLQQRRSRFAEDTLILVSREYKKWPQTGMMLHHKHGRSPNHRMQMTTGSLTYCQPHEELLGCYAKATRSRKG
jgi:hypothetical protein